jgi:TusA-related sulfurtransferase
LADAFGIAVSPPQAYALVGVGAILASACNVPLTSILLLFELTRDYLIILPALAAVGISYWVSSNWDLQGVKHQSNPAIMDPDVSDASGRHVDGEDLVIHVDDGLTISQILALCEAQNKRNVVVLNEENNVSATIHKTE